MKTLEHPYSDLSGGEWMRGNLHTHSNFSDGSCSHQQMIDEYAARGYAFLCFTDHDRLTDYHRYEKLDARGMVLIPGNEVTAGGPHLSHINASQVLRPFAQRQAVIDNVIGDDSLIVVNHPSMGASFDHFPTLRLKQLRGYHGIEIFNGICGIDRGSPYALDKWDIILAEGSRVWGFANDDAHALHDIGLGWNVAYIKERSVRGVMEAISRGRFYASTGVVISRIEVDGMRVRLETENAARIVAIATGGKRVGVADGNAIEVEIPDRVMYVRFECWGTGEQFAWTQPFWVVTTAGE